MVSRRRYIGGSKAEYIQNGLVFRLDGIDKGGDASAWTDLIGGMVFPYVTGVSPQSDHINFASGHSVFKATSTINWSLFSHTIEICSNKINGMLFYCSTANTVALGVLSGMISFGNGVRTERFGFISQNNIKSTVSINILKGYQNGIILNTQSSSYFSGGGDGFTIGSRGSQSGYFYVGDIYSIRVYNRHLTQEEATQNYLVDKQRFNL